MHVRVRARVCCELVRACVCDRVCDRVRMYARVCVCVCVAVRVCLLAPVR